LPGEIPADKFGVLNELLDGLTLNSDSNPFPFPFEDWEIVVSVSTVFTGADGSSPKLDAN